jgi:hypothetical protein
VGNDPINYGDPLGLDKECSFGERFARNFARTNRALTVDLFPLPFKVPLYWDMAHIDPFRAADAVSCSCLARARSRGPRRCLRTRGQRAGSALNLLQSEGVLLKAPKGAGC